MTVNLRLLFTPFVAHEVESLMLIAWHLIPEITDILDDYF
jgi:hypothetical protein